MSNFETRYTRKKSSLSFDPASDKTVQDMKRNCDINVIVQQYVTTGTLPSMGKTAFVKREPLFGDFSDVTDFQAMQNTLTARKNAFDGLPARVRARFKNDPNELLKAIEGSVNASESEIQELVDLGIFDKSAMKRFKVIEDSSSVKSADSSSASTAGV